MANLLFDYDGTLHDSLAIYAPAVRETYDALAAQGRVPARQWPTEVIRQWIGLPPAQMWERFLPQLSLRERQEGAARIGVRMLELVREGRARLYDGVPEALSALRRDGHRLLLLSNCPRSYLRAHTAHFGLEQWFDGLYCAEQFGYRPKYAVLPELQEQWPGAFLVIGDRVQDMEMAVRNGLPAVGCRYGYGDEQELSAADLLADTPADLPSCVEQVLRDPVA